MLLNSVVMGKPVTLTVTDQTLTAVRILCAEQLRATVLNHRGGVAASERGLCRRRAWTRPQIRRKHRVQRTSSARRGYMMMLTSTQNDAIRPLYLVVYRKP
jgi:hypothetical protein